MRTQPIIWTAALALLLGLPASLLAEQSTYTFTEMADSSGPFSSFIGASINNEGTVAFLARPRTGGEAIVVGKGGPTTTLYDTSSRFSAFGSTSPAINDNGDVAFVAELKAGGEGVFVGSGGPVTTIADTSGRFTGFINQRPPINNSGAVAFSAVLRMGGEGVFVGSGGPVTTIADTSGPFNNFSAQSINQTGIVAFAAENVIAANNAIIIGSGGPVTTLYDSNGPFQGFRPPDINNRGTVAFFAQLDDFSTGIFAGSGGPVTTIATASQPFSPFNDPAINDHGTVAFTAFLDGFGMGIFTGADPIADRVIATGDSLFGSTVVGIDFNPNGLNDTGQIAFAAALADGRRVIARADVVPEASTLTLIGLGTVSLFGAVHRVRALLMKLKQRLGTGASRLYQRRRQIHVTRFS